MRCIYSKHLKLVLGLIFGMLYCDVKYANIVFAISEFSLNVYNKFFVHFDLRKARFKGRHFGIFCWWGWQVPTTLNSEIVMQENTVLETAQQVSY